MRRSDRPLKRFLAILGALFALWIAMGASAQANPLFARQTGLSCTTCHFQHVPKLNAFGRRFKAEGYTLTSQAVLEGERLSLPPVLNAAFKASAQYTDDRSLPRDMPGRLEFPPHHGAALLVGGRLGEGMGGFVEFDGAVGTARLAFTRRLPWELGTLGLVPYVTDMSGPAVAFEPLNTGAYDMNRPFGRAAAPLTGDNPRFNLATDATGLGLYLANDRWSLAYSPFALGRPGQPTGLGLSQYARLAVTPELWGWDLGFGAGGVWGATTIASSSPEAALGVLHTDHAAGGPVAVTQRTRGWFVDAQAQGRVFGRDLGLYALYAAGDEPGLDHRFGGLGGPPAGLGLSAELTLVPGVGLLATYGQYDDGDPYDDGYDQTGLGLSIALLQNVLLEPFYEVFTGDARPAESRLTLRLLTVF